MGLSHNRLGLKGAGWARQQNDAVLPAATAMAGVDMRLSPYAYREVPRGFTAFTLDPAYRLLSCTGTKPMSGLLFSTEVLEFKHQMRMARPQLMTSRPAMFGKGQHSMSKGTRAHHNQVLSVRDAPLYTSPGPRGRISLSMYCASHGDLAHSETHKPLDI
jgi:hypothetical protein